MEAETGVLIFEFQRKQIEKIVDHVADINLTYSDIMREYLIREGLSPDNYQKPDHPCMKLLTHYMPKIKI